MKTSKKIIIYFCVLAVLAQLVLAVPPIPCAFAGTAKLDNVSIIAGDVIEARTPGGVVCGTFIHPGGAMPAGYYGPLNCKGDDPDTPQIEGAVANEKISFYVNGLKANLSASSTTNDIWVTGGTKYGTNLLAYMTGCTSNLQCNDGIACNGVETCNTVSHICLPGTAVDCTINNIAAIATCTNIPEDTNPYTWDFRTPFTSSCEEPTGTCSSGSTTITHTCDSVLCSAQCDSTHTCAATECDNLDGCQGADYYDYTDAGNTCQGDCICTNNVCSNPTITPNDIRCQASTVTRGFSSANPPQCGNLSVMLTVDINEAAADAIASLGESLAPSTEAPLSFTAGSVETPAKGGIYGTTMPINVMIDDINVVAAYYRVFNIDIPYSSSWKSLTMTTIGNYNAVFQAQEEGLQQDKNYDLQIIACNALPTEKDLEDMKNGIPNAICSELTNSAATFVDPVAPTILITLGASDINDLTKVDTSFMIDEQPPAGWVIINTGGGDISQPGHIKWSVASGAADIVYTYIVSVPCNALGVYNFTGLYKFETGAQNNVLGQTSVDVQVYGCHNNDDCNNLDNSYCSGDLIMHVEGVCNGGNACILGTPTQSQDCNSLNNNHCNGTAIKHDDYTCSNAVCAIDLTSTVQECRDSLACNGLETCSNAACVAGTAVNCNANNILGVTTCTNNPDSNPFTWDHRAAFTSSCQEPNGICTSGNTTITHACDSVLCSAQCDSTHTCAATECDNLDGCQGADYYDYTDVSNTCQSGCSCTNNVCTSPTITHNDARCGACFDDAACSDNKGCNGVETCNLATFSCVAGTPVDCSVNNVAGIAVCTNVPDSNPYTWDYRIGFNSSCQDPSGTCTTGDSAISHQAPTIGICGVTCLSNSDCSGLSTACADGVCDLNTFTCKQEFKASTTVCRSLAGACDVVDYCSGSSASCPVDAKLTSQCRSASGVCDVAEFCDGVNNNCPSDVKASLGTTCDDGNFCSSEDQCDGSGLCVQKIARDCSVNNVAGVATCTNNPDSNPFTYDARNAFTSLCDEANNLCTSGNASITHACDSVHCSAQCDSTHTCAATECDNLDGCQGADYYDYSDLANTCIGNCSCTANVCSSPTITHNDSRCGSCFNDITCNDNKGCNGVETCNLATFSCQPGTPVDCSANNVAGIATCTNIPDSNPYTWDYRIEFNSTCQDPSGTCTTGSTAINHQAPAIGICGVTCLSNNDCNSLNSACADGVCDLNTFTCKQQFKASTTVCRSSAGTCDAIDYCSGSSASCPVDAKLTSQCRSANGSCDIGEFCDGVNNNCPSDIKAPLGTTCNDGNFCSSEDQCDGSGLCVQKIARDCSVNNVAGVATCTNDPDSNPFTYDARNAFTSLCDEANNLCTSGSTTIAHACDSVHCSAQCDSTHTCAATECNNLDGCQGADYYDYTDVSNTCQSGCSCTANVCISPTITHNDARCGACFDDAACSDNKGCNGVETCNLATFSCVAGTPVDCSVNNVAGIAVCTNVPDSNPYTWDYRASFTSTCQDPSGTCTAGNSSISHQAPTIGICGVTCLSNTDCNSLNTVCGDGVCDLNTFTCKQEFKASTTVCRSSAGTCDAIDYCSGSSASCPSDAKLTSQCRSANGSCDIGEFCDGVNNNCPSDIKAPLGTTCNDGNFCSSEDQCDGSGLCVQKTARNCSVNNVAGIATCTNTPDSNPYTYDSRNAFTSICDETNNLCTSGSTTIAHTCDFTQCSAQCDSTHTCAPTECDNLDGCQGADYYDYTDVSNTCQSGCSCTNNACINPTITHNDSRCKVECSADSNCGTNSFIGNAYCSGGIDYFVNRTQDYRTYTCNNPGTPSSYCSHVDAPKVIELCCYACYTGQCTNYILADLNHDNQTDREVLDTNLDCKPDKWLYDYNFNGIYENTAMDSNFDQLLDLWLADMDEDGAADRLNNASTCLADGKPHIWLYDYNFNGIYETTNIDQNCDGTADTWLADLNEDGNPDRWTYDTNGDTKPDKWEYDYNFNGIKDAVNTDTNFDGQPDEWFADLNEDGSMDRLNYDQNFDSKPDKCDYDYDFDNVIDLTTDCS